VESYPYYNLSTNRLDFDKMLARLESLPPNSIVLLHVCCHNPTGLDLTSAQWDRVIEVLRKSRGIPFLDFAYQGFASGLDADALAVRKFADSGLGFLVANSFSKNFSLYNRRVGALSIVTSTREEAQTVLSQLKTDIRTNNSNPPRDGAEIVDTILSDAVMRDAWEKELGEMRDRIKEMRQRFIDGLASKGLTAQFEHLKEQNGMFSYSGLSKEQVHKLRNDYGIYIVDSGRICVATMTSKNVDYIVESIAKVLNGN
jgi:aromatic-amino-acid transaminase